MINYVVVDDEPKNSRILRNMLEEFCPDTRCSGSAACIEEAGELIQRLEPGLVFLDIQLPGGNAFDLLESLLPARFEIIFVTAFNDYALKAFRYAAIDYLLKPVNIEELKAAVQRAGEQLQYRQLNTRLHDLLATLRGPSATWHKLALAMGDGLTFIPVNEIVHCEASSGYTLFHMRNGETHLSTRTIREYEDLLPSDLFMRVHHSHIVNLQHVKKYHRGRGGYIELDSQVTIQVSTRRKNEFLSRFGF